MSRPFEKTDMPFPLTDDALRELYQRSSNVPEWESWRKRYGAFVAEVQETKDSALAAPEMQERLWKARDITPVGPGESVNVDGAYTAPDIVQSLIRLRNADWPIDPSERAQAIQIEFDRIMSLVSPGHTEKKPFARLARVFAALLPSELHCVLSFKAERNVVRLLGLPDDAGRIGAHILARARLREVLGTEGAMSDHIQRSTFCWWLHEQADALTSGTLAPSTRALSTPEKEQSAKLTLWSGSKQYKGATAYKGLSSSLRDLVRLTLGGVETKDLVEVLGTQSFSAQQSSGARRNMVSNAKAYGVIESRDGLLYPTDKGEEFLESGLPDALVELLLIRVFPFAHLLNLCASEPTFKELYEGLRQLHPGWKGDMAPSTALAWARDLDIVEKHGGTLRLTDSGRQWLERLPPELPIPERTSTEEAPPSAKNAFEELEETESDRIKPWPSLAQMEQAFDSDPDASRMVLDRSQLVALHLAWHANQKKRFVLLSGLSGTGKTAIVKRYAELYCNHLGLDPKVHCQLVPVAPDWSDPTGLLGYYNPLHEDPTYQAEAATQLLIEASRYPSRPFFLILDEMNLARVERYFAPILSAMESGSDVVLHANAEEVNGVPPSIPWPSNLFIAGTVNMDETTHPFSDKVLDRAFTLEFWEVDLEAFFSKRTTRETDVERVLRELFAILRPIRRHFGYRTAGEVLDFVDAGGDLLEKRQLIDQAIFSKVLPRLRGERSGGLEEALDRGLALCREHGLPRCEEKLESMQRTLHDTGITRFWG